MDLDIIKKVRHELNLNSNEITKSSGLKFFKEDVRLYGVKSAVVGKIAKEALTLIKEKNKIEIFDYCEELWRSGFMEESFVACHWSYSLRRSFRPEDFPAIEDWVTKYVGNWASCDTLCNHTVGTFVQMFPDYIQSLKKWTQSKNRWVRRASAVSLIVPARNGKFLKDIFAIADALLSDGDDLVQKGYGWMLKSASQAHQKEVFDYVLRHKKTMPRTALRYAIEKMPEELKQEAMER